MGKATKDKCSKYISIWDIFRALKQLIAPKAILLAAFVSFASGAFYQKQQDKAQFYQWWNATAPEPSQCALCDNAEFSKRHAPCIFHLETGYITELEIYERVHNVDGENADIQEMSRNVFQFGSGSIPLSIDLNVGLQQCTAIIVPSPDYEGMDASKFCKACRAILFPAASHELVILDLYDLSDAKAYPFKVNASYTIRDYEVSIAKNKGSYEIKAEGHLF